MTKEEIMELIQEYVRVDIYGDLYGHDRVAEIITDVFDRMPTGGGIENWADYMDHLERNYR
jgi:hypothetical protein